jgi:hypothetical protein
MAYPFRPMKPGTLRRLIKLLEEPTPPSESHTGESEPPKKHAQSRPSSKLTQDSR